MTASSWGRTPRRSTKEECGRRRLTGEQGGPDHWLRVWALRGLLRARDDRATGAVVAALQDEARRVREMALRVVARHEVGDALTAAAERQDDPVPRVRAAAGRALVRLTRAEA